MPLWIERIFIRRTDPLKEDLDLETRALNLIYGRNEAGKTLVTEFIIRCLFRSRSSWKMRKDWKPGRGSRIVLSGLAGESVGFGTGKPWLEDYFSAEGSALYPDLCRLMIVRGGDAALGEGAAAPASRKSIGKILSREGLLETIRAQIKQKVRQARIVNGEILPGVGGPGILNNREKARSDISRIDSLMERARKALSGATRADLVRRLGEARTASGEMEKARNHRAYVLEGRRSELSGDLAALPAGEEVSEALSDMKLYESRLMDLKGKQERVEELRKSCVDLSWMNNLGLFGAFTTDSPGTERGGILSVLMYAGLALSVVFFLLDLAVPGVVCLLLAVAAVFTRVRSLQRFVQDQKPTGAEREEIEKEFRERFSMEMPDLVTLKTMIDGLEKETIELDYLEGEIGSLQSGSDALLEKTDRLLAAFPQGETDDDRITRLRDILQKRTEIETAVSDLRLELAELAADGVNREPASVEWDIDAYDGLAATAKGLEEELESADNSSSSLAREISAEVENPELDRLEDLLHALIEKREITSSEYRNLTSEILAKILVFEVIEELAASEDETIRRGLQSGAVADNLRLLTGYSSINIGDDGGLLLGTDDGAEPFKLDELSTGTVEQVLLSLRLGLLADILKDPAFLVLDDAFQHSDWLRREQMAELILNLVSRGWQIICLTMDDHIRDLLRGLAEKRLSESEFLFREL